MNNTFENAYFGKAYKTRDGKKAIYLCDYVCAVKLSVFGGGYTIEKYNPNGRWRACNHGNIKHSLDIISEWQEEINEEELDMLANEYEDRSGLELGLNDIHDAYKAGYRKAKEEQL